MSREASSNGSISRRLFLQSSAASAAAAAYWSTASSYARIPGANDRLNVAFIGVGGIASGQHVPKLEQLGAGCTTYCDADRNRWGACADRWPDAEGYTDYRRMYDAHHKEFDAVMVGTPDHSHYPATIIAMMHGKHVYTQKPLTHTVWEARQLAIAQKKYKVATQMGNQGHASENLRGTIDYLRSGAIGDLQEAHVWTDRPWWRQGLPRPTGEQPVPSNLDWEAWIGPAPMRPFLHDPTDRWGGVYHPFNWRGWWDFGCGALGDMAMTSGPGRRNRQPYGPVKGLFNTSRIGFKFFLIQSVCRSIALNSPHQSIIRDEATLSNSRNIRVTSSLYLLILVLWLLAKTAKIS